ncbi:MAG: hypothetical protein HOO06_08980 [Bdellovibrionaceae bacterium]|mgnify:CR=1 FL=1|jgi:hypothetical protein|nr:hypothetical protein [Pseudobdellovibrionaceae bacterium]
MKLLFLITIYLTTLPSLHSLAGELSTSDYKRVAKDLDNICGDTWCEADFDWHIYNLKCDFLKETCEISLDLRDNYYTNNANELTPLQIKHKIIYDKYFKDLLPNTYFEDDEDTQVHVYPQLCTLSGYKNKFELLTGNSYSQMLFDDVTECINSIETKYYDAQDIAQIKTKLTLRYGDSFFE